MVPPPLRVYSITWAAFALATGLGVPRASVAPELATAVAVGRQALPSLGWLSSAAHQIAEREYRASANDQGLQAPN